MKELIVDRLKKKTTVFSNFFIDFLQKRVASSNKLDVIIFGASGFAGRHAVLEAVGVLKDLHWGIAGRDKRKLQTVLDEAAARTSVDLSDVPIVVANLNHSESLIAMASRCRVVVNCCGPYYLHGEAVIRACLAAGTHHVDMSFEPHYMELMQLKYHDQAKDVGIFIVSSCGFHSIPMDIGMNYVHENFEGTPNYVEAYSEFWTTSLNPLSPIGSLAVWESLVMSFARIKEIPSLRMKLVKKKGPELKPRSSYKALLHESQVVKGVCVPFPIIDPQVVERSQYHFYEQSNKRPIQFHNYIVFPNFLMGLFFFIWCFVIGLMSQMQCTRDLLLKYPKIFSLGLFTPKGPSEEHLMKTSFRITFNAVGWPESSRDRCEEPCSKHLTAVVSGVNPIYGAACVSLLSCAVTILREGDKMPEGGGVFPPGAAFAQTSIISELEKHPHGVKFVVIRE